MKLVSLEECANGKKHVQGKENGPRIHNGKGTNNNIMPSGNINEKIYMKQVVIYLLWIWIIDSIPQISVSCVRVVYPEFMGIRLSVHWMVQNRNAAWNNFILHKWKYRLQVRGYVG